MVTRTNGRKQNMSLNGYAKIERLKLALSHANEKENLLNKLLEQKIMRLRH